MRERCTRVEQALDGRRGRNGGLGERIEFGIAVRDLAARDGKQVLRHEAEACERVAFAAPDGPFERMRHERADGVSVGNVSHGGTALVLARVRDRARRK
jgi:hypothetical protein